MIPTSQTRQPESGASSRSAFSDGAAYTQYHEYVRGITDENIQAAAQGTEVREAQEAVLRLYDQDAPSTETLDRMLAEDRALRAAEARQAVQETVQNPGLTGEAATIATIERMSPEAQAVRLGQLATVLDGSIRIMALNNPERIDFDLAA